MVIAREDTISSASMTMEQSPGPMLWNPISTGPSGIDKKINILPGLVRDGDIGFQGIVPHLSTSTAYNCESLASCMFKSLTVHLPIIG